MEKKLIVDGDILYLAGTEELTAKAQRRLIRYFQGAPGKVLEIGCGKGVMLSIFKEKGVGAYGIDLSPGSVEYCRSKGLEALHADLLSHLRTLGPNSVGGIFCAHVIEHMTPSDAIEFIREAWRTLLPSGKLVLVTPNAKDLRTTERFWLDVTHVRPYPEKLLRFLLEQQGFRVAATTSPEVTGNFLLRLAKAFLRIWFMGFMFTGDLVVIAEK